MWTFIGYALDNTVPADVGPNIKSDTDYVNFELTNIRYMYVDEIEHRIWYSPKTQNFYITTIFAMINPRLSYGPLQILPNINSMQACDISNINRQDACLATSTRQTLQVSQVAWG